MGRLRGGAIIPNSPSSLLKQVIGKDVRKMLNGTQLFWSAVFAFVVCAIGAIWISTSGNNVRTIAQVFLWIATGLLALGIFFVLGGYEQVFITLGDEYDTYIWKDTLQGAGKGDINPVQAFADKVSKAIEAQVTRIQPMQPALPNAGAAADSSLIRPIAQAASAIGTKLSDAVSQVDKLINYTT